VHTQTIDYADGEVELQGYLACDASATTPRPGIVIAHAWRGQRDFEREKAEKLAGLGYVGFAADVYGAARLAEDNDEATALMTPLLADREALRRRIRAAAHTLKEHDAVDPHRIAAIGYCFGGLTVLELARSGEPVRGVVSFHGLLERGDAPTAESIPAKILVLHGAEDPLAPMDRVVALAAELSEAEADWQVHVYGGAMHAFTNPHANDLAQGTVYDETADRRSWQTMQRFLEEVLA
jgi:dienelactone hydrolase